MLRKCEIVIWSWRCWQDGLVGWEMVRWRLIRHSLDCRLPSQPSDCIAVDLRHYHTGPSSLHIISHFNVDHYPRIHFVLNPLMMQDAQSLSPFEEQQSFSKLKSFDEVSHKLWGRHWKRMPMQHKSKTLQNLREITLLVSVAGSWACCPGHRHGHGPRVSNVAKGRYRVARAAKSSQHWQLRLV